MPSDCGSADELVLLAVLTALTLAQGKDAEEIGLVSAFLVVVADTLGLLAVVLAAGESEKEAKGQKEAEESLEARLKKIEEQLKELKACCEKKGS